MSMTQATARLLAQYSPTTLPETITDAVTRAEAVGRYAVQIDSDGAADAILAALDNGDDPVTAPAVSRAILASQAQGVVNLAKATAWRRVESAIHDARDELVKTWRPVFDEAAATLIKSARVIGDYTLEPSDAAPILAGGQAKIDAWNTARTARSVIDSTLTAWKLIHDDVPHASDTEAAAFRLTYTQWRLALSKHPVQRTVWDVVRTIGVAPTLPTAAELAERIAYRAKTIPQQANANNGWRSEADKTAVK